LLPFRGWWNGVAAGDVDGDGRMDLVVANWGINHLVASVHPARHRLYYGDFAGSGGVDLLESDVDPGTGRDYPLVNLMRLRAALPGLAQIFATFEAYSRAAVTDVLAGARSSVSVVEASDFSSTVFLNRGDRFEARVLPLLAQAAPAFGVVVEDFDGDGREDVFLAQNFFAQQPGSTRQDAGLGLLLLGDGKGGFAAARPARSGILVFGEQRGCAVADYDHDGRPDLVVSQNGAATRLFRNRLARAGVRVRVRGPAGNPSGFGAQLRVTMRERTLPLREIHGGGGYWSQDSAVQLLPLGGKAAKLELKTPGGRTVTAQIPAGAGEVEVNFEGEMRLIR